MAVVELEKVTRTVRVTLFRYGALEAEARARLAHEAGFERDAFGAPLFHNPNLVPVLDSLSLEALLGVYESHSAALDVRQVREGGGAPQRPLPL